MPFSEDLKRAVQIAQALAKEYQQAQFAPAHFFKALLHNEIGLASLLSTLDKDIHYLRDWADVRMEGLPKAIKVPDMPVGDDKIRMVMEMAELIRLQMSKDVTDALCALAALLKPGLAFTSEQLKSLPLTQKEMLDAIVEESALQKAVSPAKIHTTAQTSSNNALYKYCIDKTALATEGKLDPILGRDRETRMMAEILGRRTKPNVILVGEPGVGKTALLDGFARNIAEKKVPLHLQSALLFELDTGSLVAGASYKGEVEDRLKSIIKEIKQFGKAILFVDEIHVLLDSKGALGAGVANLLKPELARGELTLIGATTNEEYRKFLEPDEAFSRRFEVLRVEEPDAETATRMLQHLLPLYEKHHGIRVAADAAAETVRLAKRYIKDRRLPDAAIDLLDRTMAAIRMMSETSKTELEPLQTQLDQLAAAGIGQEEDIFLRELKWFHVELKGKVSSLLINQLEEEHTAEMSDSAALLAYLRNALTVLLKLAGNHKDTVERHDVAAVVSHKTGIPLGKIQSKEREKLLNIGEVLQKRVIGQDHAVKALSDAILESRSGLIKAGQPIGSFFLLGPTGTGKTELAKALADFLFNDESFLVRFDMSEFKEEHSAALLYGAPPGYVGYEEGGLLVNKIREKPYSVVLFDEIEKAHPSVFDIFLQILDEGRLHDRLGKEGDFSNAIILFTSNIGSEFVMEQFGKGSIPTVTDLMEKMARHFRPEFLARLTEIIPFAPISEENVVSIFNIHLRSLTDPLTKQGIALELSDEARKHLALSGFSPRYGARPLKGVIRNSLRKPISKMIIAGQLTKGSVLTIRLNEKEELEWDVVHPLAELPLEVGSLMSPANG
jgi:ATP-dependent Clp protease ATP-binding subunit ClpA